MLVGVSRIQDYRHSAIDVTWGAIIGIVFAVYAYFQYYPSLFSPRSQVPHPPRDFSYMITDSQDSTEQADHLESSIGIRLNHEFVGESTQTQGVLVGEEVRGRGTRGEGAGYGAEPVRAAGA
ncbi:hypothetical protein BGZ58_002325 [Dissophora ornata]|nr:hypothetical protein BGZ58_002325 [Dissophora ornata]